MYVHANDCCWWLVRWLSGSVTRLKLMLSSSTDGWAMNEYTGRGMLQWMYDIPGGYGGAVFLYLYNCKRKILFSWNTLTTYIRMLMEFSYLPRSGTPTPLIRIIHTNISIFICEYLFIHHPKHKGETFMSYKKLQSIIISLSHSYIMIGSVSGWSDVFMNSIHLQWQNIIIQLKE